MSITSLPYVLAQANAQAIGSFVPLILVFGIFWFLIIAPARKRQKALQATVDALKKGDRVVTNGGLHGEVISSDGSVAILEIADDVKVKVSKSAIAGLEGEAQPGVTA